MTNCKTLTDLSEGQSGCVINILSSSDMRRRLIDLGMTPGTQIKCLQKSCKGEIAAYFIRGAAIALRYDDSDMVLIRS